MKPEAFDDGRSGNGIQAAQECILLRLSRHNSETLLGPPGSRLSCTELRDREMASPSRDKGHKPECCHTARPLCCSRGSGGLTLTLRLVAPEGWFPASLSCV